ncbi:hypothetical protein [Chryseobacterium sp. FH1]|uniref:hypothetical protein n=1 Tax=Chryseobacterium sp. FH1 TaxID=1233951 RepID=UPI0004E3A85F|nr:hypothetical protein [Chryseobacterium sp. FH1]KFC18712.1 hypothetical protein IO90_17085 [Chryseobacterium sp. FH1]
MIAVADNTTIYLLCPANLSTGGPEELHQLGAQLNSIGRKVFMCYDNYDKEKNTSPVHDSYKKYNVPFCFEVENNKNNIVIFPETYSHKVWDKEFSKTQKVIWWMSVVFYLKTLENTKKRFEKKKFYSIKKYFKNYPVPTVKKLRDSAINHIAHSYFSLDFLRKNNIKVIGQISGYMDEIFHDDKDLKSRKENLIIYNALKNGEFLNKIIKLTPHLNWLGLQGMTLQEIADWMARAKVYIDFGFHPGREKMPREACLLDCCLISGKQGSAQFKEDMPIPDEYHFVDSEQNIPAIISKIEDCLEHFEDKIKDFEHYKNLISNEKKLFEESVNSIFKTNINL